MINTVNKLVFNLFKFNINSLDYIKTTLKRSYNIYPIKFARKWMKKKQENFQ